MRKITADAVRAFRNRQPFKRGNTLVKVFDNSVVLCLHGNMIAELATDGALYISDGGWQSNTTKERLNGFPTVNIHQKDFRWFLNGVEWDGSKIKVDW